MTANTDRVWANMTALASIGVTVPSHTDWDAMTPDQQMAVVASALAAFSSWAGAQVVSNTHRQAVSHLTALRSGDLTLADLAAPPTP